MKRNFEIPKMNPKRQIKINNFQKEIKNSYQLQKNLRKILEKHKKTKQSLESLKMIEISL